MATFRGRGAFAAFQGPASAGAGGVMTMADANSVGGNGNPPQNKLIDPSSASFWAVAFGLGSIAIVLAFYFGYGGSRGAVI